LRVYPDTNVIVSAFTTRGLSSEVFRIILAEHTLVLSRIVLEELQSVLREKIELPFSKVTEITDFLSRFDIISDFEINESIKLRDSGDIPVLSAALSGDIDFLVTGDKDLLVVSDKYGIKIVTPREFLKLIKSR
jgi:putative PIN family toxin of toxin-antitoxin system